MFFKMTTSSLRVSAVRWAVLALISAQPWCAALPAPGTPASDSNPLPARQSPTASDIALWKKAQSFLSHNEAPDAFLCWDKLDKWRLDERDCRSTNGFVRMGFVPVQLDEKPVYIDGVAKDCKKPDSTSPATGMCYGMLTMPGAERVKSPLTSIAEHSAAQHSMPSDHQPDGGAARTSTQTSAGARCKCRGENLVRLSLREHECCSGAGWLAVGFAPSHNADLDLDGHYIGDGCRHPSMTVTSMGWCFMERMAPRPPSQMRSQTRSQR